MRTLARRTAGQGRIVGGVEVQESDCAGVATRVFVGNGVAPA